MRRSCGATYSRCVFLVSHTAWMQEFYDWTLIGRAATMRLLPKQHDRMCLRNGRIHLACRAMWPQSVLRWPEQRVQSACSCACGFTLCACFCSALTLDKLQDIKFCAPACLSDPGLYRLQDCAACKLVVDIAKELQVTEPIPSSF